MWSINIEAQQNNKSVTVSTGFSIEYQDSVLAVLQRMQNHDTYVKVTSVYDTFEVYNFSNQEDTLVLYFADTKFYADNWKTKQYLRACFLSAPFRFYQVEIGNKKSGFTVGKIDQEAKTIEILRNGKIITTLSELCYTIVE